MQQSQTLASISHLEKLLITCLLGTGAWPGWYVDSNGLEGTDSCLGDIEETRRDTGKSWHGNIWKVHI
jgi:hypothetical protein